MRRLGPGPVFSYEWTAMARRWQPYALRAGFVALVLASLAVVWWSKVAGRLMVTDAQRGQVGLVFFGGIVGSMIIAILAASPAVTAGAISRDKARGHLELLLASGLTDAEIVLGKLAAWLTPAVGLVLAAMPVGALGALIGGIDPVAMTGAFLIALGLAVLGATLALTLSVWGTRSHEVLLSVYAFWTVWMLTVPSWDLIAFTWSVARPPIAVQKTSPFGLSFMPYVQPGQSTIVDDLIFAGACLLTSSLLAAVAVARLRPVAVRQMGLGAATGGRRRSGWLPGPDLDRDPIGWRERRRARLSPWGRSLIGLYGAISAAFTAMAVVEAFGRSPSPGWFQGYVIAFESALGLPMLGIWAASTLAEERVGGAIDVLLTTPRSTREFIRAKWWAVGRRIGWFLVLPAVGFAALAWQTWFWRRAALPLLLLGAQGAAFVSLGLALATWTRRFPVVVGLYVGIVLTVTGGWGYAAEVGIEHPTNALYAAGSPFYAAFYAAYYQALIDVDAYTTHLFLAEAAWTLFYLAAAALLGWLAIVGVERRIGRMPERSRRPKGRPAAQTATGSPAGSARGSASMYS